MPTERGRGQIWYLWSHPVLILCILHCFLGVSRGKWLGYKTEPELTREDFMIKVQVEDRSRLAPGYLFLDILRGKLGWGPQIYQMDGTPIWLSTSTRRTQNLHVCDFEGVSGTHLCYFSRTEYKVPPTNPKIPPGFTQYQGSNVILDHTYKLVRNFTHGFNDLPINGHAFQMLKGGNSYVSPLAEPKVVDLRPYGGLKHGWVRNGCIDEADVRTGKSLFHWCYIESGLPIWETKTYFESKKQHTNATAHKFGDGTSSRPFDFLHFNAVDKTSEGDYYISVRHADQILKIAGLNHRDSPPGTVLWRLGGRSSDFQFEGFPNKIPFSRQHDVRAVYAGEPGEVISIFNNGWDGALKQSQDYSDGQFITIDTNSMTARLARSYPHPEGKLSKGRGSVQQLPNENVLVGYGSIPELTEFDLRGNVLYHAHYSQHLSLHEFSYRVLKYPWKGLPYWPPKVVAYCLSCGSPLSKEKPLVAYASWNGATEIRRWQFYTASKENESWIPAGSFVKSDFETEAKLLRLPTTPKSFRAYVRADAIDDDGKVLGSAVTKTFVPRPGLLHRCNAKECHIAHFRYDSRDSIAWLCEFQVIVGFAAVILLSLFIEALNFIAQNMILLRKFFV